MQVTLSRRNLLALLHRLEMADSTCTIVKPGGIVVTAETDEVHYRHRSRGPGQMHPDTEEFIIDMEEALKIIRTRREAPQCKCRNAAPMVRRFQAIWSKPSGTWK